MGPLLLGIRIPNFVRKGTTMNNTSKTDLKELGLYLGFIIGKHFSRIEHLHYGYWKDNLEVDISNLRKAQDAYVDLILSHIPAEVQSILDVGCGAGKFTKKLVDNGYQADGVSPNPYLLEHIKANLSDQSELFHCCYENVQTHKTYDLILFSESFQYVVLEQALNKSLQLLNEGGYLLICDFFQKDVEGKSPIGGGHRLSKFYQTMESSPFKLILDLDITQETAPSLEIVNDLMMGVIHPIWKVLANYMQHHFQTFSRGFSWVYRKKIAKIHRKYFSQATNSKNFAHFKSYHLLVYQKV